MHFYLPVWLRSTRVTTEVQREKKALSWALKEVERWWVEGGGQAVGDTEIT